MRSRLGTGADSFGGLWPGARPPIWRVTSQKAPGSHRLVVSLRVGQDFGDRSQTDGGKHGVVIRVGTGPQPHIECPAPTASPARVINGQRSSEHLPRVG